MRPPGLDAGAPDAARPRRLPGWPSCLLSTVGALSPASTTPSVPGTAISIGITGAQLEFDEYHAGSEVEDYVFTEPHRRHVYTQFPIDITPHCPDLFPSGPSCSASCSNSPCSCRVRALDVEDAFSLYCPFPASPSFTSSLELVGSAIVSMTEAIFSRIALVERLVWPAQLGVASDFCVRHIRLAPPWSRFLLWQHGPSMLMLFSLACTPLAYYREKYSP